jgi:hypothetical protein
MPARWPAMASGRGTGESSKRQARRTTGLKARRAEPVWRRRGNNRDTEGGPFGSSRRSSTAADSTAPAARSDLLLLDAASLVRIDEFPQLRGKQAAHEPASAPSAGSGMPVRGAPPPDEYGSSDPTVGSRLLRLRLQSSMPLWKRARVSSFAGLRGSTADTVATGRQQKQPAREPRAACGLG